ncbi:hypothetical protein L7F22_030423 [Adiantum nelumboides]|nr:hypothetical protein [Adiantum nelumboides]
MSNEQEDKSNNLLNYYVGDFEGSLRHGRGTFYYASGAIYKGEWAENTKHGVGSYIDESGTVLQGNFIKDRLQETTSLQDPLQKFLENEEKPMLLKERLSNVLMRHNSVLRDTFSLYSSNLKKEETSTFPSLFKAMFIHQVRQLCYDANIVQCKLGLAQIDWLLQPGETAWDDSFDIHKRDRQIIFREFCDFIIILAKSKFCNEDCLLDDKVDKLVRLHLAPVLAKDCEGASCILKNVDALQTVFDGYAPQLQKLFYETLRGVGTSDGTILLRSLDLFAQRYKPQWGLQRERLLFALIKELYQCDIGIGDDGAIFLNTDINYIKFQVAIYIYATTIKDQGANIEPFIMLNNFIKEVILPNLSTDLETLLDEDIVPNLPNINTKGNDRNGLGKGPHSMPGSKRSTPREGKLPQGAKSAPQTPLRKKI